MWHVVLDVFWSAQQEIVYHLRRNARGFRCSDDQFLCSEKNRERINTTEQNLFDLPVNCNQATCFVFSPHWLWPSQVTLGLDNPTKKYPSPQLTVFNFYLHCEWNSGLQREIAKIINVRMCLHTSHVTFFYRHPWEGEGCPVYPDCLASFDCRTGWAVSHRFPMDQKTLRSTYGLVG